MGGGVVFPACFLWKRGSVDPVFPACWGCFSGNAGLGCLVSVDGGCVAMRGSCFRCVSSGNAGLARTYM
jgi:hypothetical protein